MKSCVFLCLIVSSVISLTQAQVTHNFKVAPTKTDCHTIVDLKHTSLDSALIMLKGAEYRFKEELQISRYRSPRQLTYLSCQGDDGFLIAKEDEHTTAVFQKVPKILWDSIVNSQDPINLYQSGIFKEYRASEY